MEYELKEKSDLREEYNQRLQNLQTEVFEFFNVVYFMISDKLAYDISYINQKQCKIVYFLVRVRELSILHLQSPDLNPHQVTSFPIATHCTSQPGQIDFTQISYYLIGFSLIWAPS